MISSFNLTNGTLITQLFNFFLDPGLKCTQVYRFVQYTPRKVINSFVQFVVDAGRASDESPLSGMAAETMKLLDKSSYGYQIMNISNYIMTKYIEVIKNLHQLENYTYLNLCLGKRKDIIIPRFSTAV